MTARRITFALAAFAALAALAALEAASVEAAPDKGAPPPAKGAPPPAPAPAGGKPAPDAATRAKASEHSKQAQAFFTRGDWDRAITEYQAAFDLSAEPLLLFNIALCHDRANRPEQALATFKRYIELAPEGAVAEEAREDIARLIPIVEKLTTDRTAEEARKKEEAAKAAQQQQQQQQQRQQQQQQARSIAKRRKVSLVVVIAGAAVTATGGVFHVLSSQTRGRLESTSEADAYFDDRDTFKTQRAVAITGYAVGGATLLTGLILGATVLGHREAPQVSATMTSGGAMVTVGWSR